MGVTVEELRPGDGVSYPKTGQTVAIHYTGALKNGDQFDSSLVKGNPLRFNIGQGQVIQGLDEGVAKMSVGEISELTVSPDYGYGAAGVKGVIPPNATLIFEVELLSLE